MFLGNIKEDVFDFDYDTRIYRYNSSAMCSIYDRSGTPQTNDLKYVL